MKISNKGKYTFFIAIDLAQQEETKLQDIAKRQNISTNDVTQVLNKLISANMVIKEDSQDYILTKSPDKILIKDLFDAIEEDVSSITLSEKLEKFCLKESHGKDLKKSFINEFLHKKISNFFILPN